MKERSCLCTLLVLGALVSCPAQGWLARYDGPAGDEDEARAIAADGAGGVYVTGQSWGSTFDWATVRYGPSGNQLWVSRYDGPAGGFDGARAVAAQGDRVVVTGASAAANMFDDMLTIAYTTAGETAWTARYDGPGQANDAGLAVGFDPAGRVYVTGYSNGGGEFWDFTTACYSPAGAELWLVRHPTEDESYAVGLAVDEAGNCHVTGSSGSPYTMSWDYLTIKYDSAGNELWGARYNGPADEHDEARAIALDAAGNVYVTGGSARPGTNADFTTIKYSPAGETLWLRRYDGPASGADWANAIAVDAAGNAYVTGSSQGTTTDVDYATVKYAPDGTQLWVAHYDGPASGYDEARAIAADVDGIYVTGASAGDGTRADYATVKYDFAGRQEWVSRYDGPASRFDEPRGIALDGTGGVCVTGFSVGDGTGADYATLRYATCGAAEPAPGDRRVAARSGPTIVRGRLVLGSGFAAPGSDAVLLDAAGRRVMALAPGANDMARLAPGVYFARSGNAVARVVVGK
ncbi:MAG: SBBP repeat-containing protein [bacterium]